MDPTLNSLAHKIRSEQLRGVTIMMNDYYSHNERAKMRLEDFDRKLSYRPRVTIIEIHPLRTIKHVIGVAGRILMSAGRLMATYAEQDQRQNQYPGNTITHAPSG